MTPRADVLGCGIDRIGHAETRRPGRGPDRRPGGYSQHMAINTAKLVSLRDDDRLREIVEGCELVNADGQAVIWASRLLGDPLPERVAGIDLMEELLGLAERKGYRVYILGAREDVLDQAVRADPRALPRGSSSPAGETVLQPPRRRPRSAPRSAPAGRTSSSSR